MTNNQEIEENIRLNFTSIWRLDQTTNPTRDNSVFYCVSEKNTNCNPFLSSYSIGLSGQKHLLGAVLKNTFIVTLVKLEQKFKKKSVTTLE